MSTKEIKERLEQARLEQRLLRKEIDELRAILRAKGINPDSPKIDLVPRNKTMFREWKKGKTFKEVGVLFGLSTTRVASVCKKVECVLLMKRPGYNRYKSLEKYLS